MRTPEEIAEKLSRPHHYCDDGYYSCPQCAVERADDPHDDPCNCGRDKEVTRIASALRDYGNARLEAAAEAVEVLCPHCPRWDAVAEDIRAMKEPKP